MKQSSFFWPFVSSLGIWEDPITCKLHQTPSSFFLKYKSKSGPNKKKPESQQGFIGSESMSLAFWRSLISWGGSLPVSHMGTLICPAPFETLLACRRTISAKAQHVFIYQCYFQVSGASGGLPWAPRCPKTQLPHRHLASVLASGRGHIMVDTIPTKHQDQREE